MKTSRKFRIPPIVNVAAALALVVSPVLDASSLRLFPLSAEEWARPRSGAVIPQLDAVRGAVRYWELGADAMIVIRHPGEDSGVLWAAELRDWLVSLGVPGDAIELRAGSGDADELTLAVGSRGELEQ